jgi:transcriptional regulator with XRE-family HTH domain
MNNNEFARRLRARIDNDPDLSEAGLAVKAGLNNSTIRGLLAGRAKNPRLDTMEKICAALGTTVKEFMNSDQSAEEKEIVRLAGLLSEPLRRQLLGYAEALAAGQALPPEPPAGEE